VRDDRGIVLTEDDLSIILWQSDIGGTLGDALIFERTLSEGDHTITLTVESRYGLTGSGTIPLTVSDNLPPLARIDQPASGEIFFYRVITEAGVDCSATATDPEDGPLTGEALQWTLLKRCTALEPELLPWSGSGETTTIAPEYLGPCPESMIPPIFEVFLEATDSGGVSHIVSHAFTVVHEISFASE
jgi:hypothetical protein